LGEAPYDKERGLGIVRLSGGELRGVLLRSPELNKPVARGRLIVAAQKKLVTAIKARGGDASGAEALLDQFERTSA
jgi:hypothetical protein